MHATSTPGFIVNRCARPFYGEALRLLAEGAADAATIDAVLREAGGFRMGAFELMDLIGNDVNFAVTRSVWEACYHDPRYAPSVLQQERVAAGFLGRKSGRGFYDYAADAQPPRAGDTRCASVCRMPSSCTAMPVLLAPLVARIAARRHRRAARDPALDAFPDGALAAGDAVLALSDGRTATTRASATGTRRTSCSSISRSIIRRAGDWRIAAADGCAAGCVRCCGRRSAGAPGSPCRGSTMSPASRCCAIVATLANEAADAVTHGVASAADVDVAMQKGVNYPRGPLRWADDVGVARIRDVLHNLAAHYGEDRYRLSPLIARRYATGRCLAAPAPSR